MRSKNTYVAVDIGGTKIRAALFPEMGMEPIKIKRIKTLGRKKTTLARLVTLIREVWPKKEKVLALGVAVPGYLNPHTGIVYSAPNIPDWKQLPLGQILQEKFQSTVMLGNDANLAAMGEWKYGAGQGAHNLLYLTISTGIGGGVIINNNLLSGAQGLAAELGHVTILPDGPLCSCGQRGHLEALSSGNAIAKFVRDRMAQGSRSSLKSKKHIDAQDVSLAAHAGDALAQEAMDRAAGYLGMALANFVHIFNPEMIILGGGVLQSGPRFLEKTRVALGRYTIAKEYLDHVHITKAQLGDDSGLYGALALAHTSATAPLK
jgi:glucokinase